ncbi:Basic helix-loop-helix DNA-binding superfamily protein, putative isoform 1 [Hibiscus syriacus]|uniref:Basic helix-loop-helix DNA-binding superfamily protein, putative isoform 1 n=1 Tax=Hibiscus syriacus TaxID=106335 RepID=A0A6A2ZHG9_HIBSY|nr:Basic helix-loop-helix DNA-binding superfamily protein, putative isoform 1 [Hibiscus syriacus]
MSLDSSSSKQRSFNSTSSNNHSNTSNSKKRKSNQKTLGMAWVANSLSGSRSSPFSDFGRKLQNQFDVQASNSSRSGSSTKPIFDGVSIFVDGFTIPSSQSVGLPIPLDLTHHLENAVESVYIGRAEKESDIIFEDDQMRVPYQLDQLANNQPTLSAFFTPKSKPTDEGAFTNAICEVKHETGLLCLKDASKDASFSEEEPKEVEVVEPSNPQEEDESLANNRHQSCPEQSSAPVSSHCFDNRGIRGSLRSSVIGPSKQRHSTLDPNFVENYFKGAFFYREEIDEIAFLVVGVQIPWTLFFVSVVIRSRPELNDKPVAVCHSDNPKGTTEISSANYPARDYGIKAGMFVRDAKGLCPQLVILPYNFEAYEEVADQFYDILHKHCNRVQCKAGIAKNMLMARLATRTAKPNGQRYIHPERVDEYLDPLPIKALPGMGHDSLQKDFGIKIGEMLWNYSRGVYNRLVGMSQESKSIGAEVNWGLSFRDLQHAQHFLLDLCKEVSLRLQGCGVQGRTFTLKGRKDAGEPAKFMGCGDCENPSHSTSVPLATDDAEVLQRITKQPFGSFHIGLKVQILLGKAPERNSLKSWLMCASGSSKEQFDINSIAKECNGTDFEGKNMDGNSSVLHNASVENSVHGTNNSSNEVEAERSHNSDPVSLSRPAVEMRQLPEEPRADIFEALPAHRIQETSAMGPKTDNKQHPLDIKSAADNQPGSTDSASDAWNEAIHSFSELLMSYIKLKIVVDIEEIYVCFRLLRRLSTKSEFFLEVYNLFFSHLQVRAFDLEHHSRGFSIYSAALVHICGVYRYTMNRYRYSKTNFEGDLGCIDTLRSVSIPGYRYTQEGAEPKQVPEQLTIRINRGKDKRSVLNSEAR